jgi:hypothetical protein
MTIRTRKYFSKIGDEMIIWPDTNHVVPDNVVHHINILTERAIRISSSELLDWAKLHDQLEAEDYE